MSSGRDSLGFRRAATEAFQFLVELFGFSVVRQESTLVRYESQAAFVNVYHGRSSYEIGVEVGLLADPLKEEKFMLADILETCGMPGAAGVRSASTAEELSQYLPELADLAKRYGVRAFRGEREFYLELRQTQTRLAHEFLLAQRLRRAQVIAAEAFERGDYARVVAVLKPLARYLDEGDAGRLADAEHRIG